MLVSIDINYIPFCYPVYNVVNIDFFSLLQTHINEYLSQGMVMLCGDFNSRFGKRSDLIPCDRNVNFYDDDIYLPDIPIPRDCWQCLQCIRSETP